MWAFHYMTIRSDFVPVSCYDCSFLHAQRSRFRVQAGWKLLTSNFRMQRSNYKPSYAPCSFASNDGITGIPQGQHLPAEPRIFKSHDSLTRSHTSGPGSNSRALQSTVWNPTREFMSRWNCPKASILFLIFTLATGLRTMRLCYVGLCTGDVFCPKWLALFSAPYSQPAHI